jgi:nucleotide-binding universal stress UspA family protein
MGQKATNNMETVLCATRGSEASRRTQERAIALAKEREANLIFLYVVDASFAGDVDEPMKDALIDELRRLGKCLLLIAQERAQESGLEAEVAIREGTVQDAIEQFIREAGINTLVVGATQPGTGSQTFEPERLASFTDAIRRATGIEVIVVE